MYSYSAQVGEKQNLLQSYDLARLNRSFRHLLPRHAVWICLQCSMPNITNRGLPGCCQGLSAWSLGFSLNYYIRKQQHRERKNSISLLVEKSITLKRHI